MSITKDNKFLQKEQFSVPENYTIELKAGSAININTHKEEISILDKNKHVQLVITIKEHGLVIDINAAQLNINAEQELNLTGKKINIKATDQLHIRSGGNLVQEIYKDSLTEVGGINKMLAAVQKITATSGEVVLKANDDVKLNGERVKLNCD
jgi:hypothetical protein